VTSSRIKTFLEELPDKKN